MPPKNSPPARCETTRADKVRTLLLFLLHGGGGSLRRLGLGHALLELVDASGGIDELLHARVERMAGIADTHQNDGLGRARLDDIATGATNLRFKIFRM